MAETGATYEFQPHERPFLPGSPATPEHPTGRRIGYFAIGVLISLTAGFANSLLIGNLPQLQGALGLTPVQGGWLYAAYSMTNVCMGFLLLKFRQQFGLQRFMRPFLFGFVALMIVQVFVRSYGTELVVRGAAGIVASGFTPLGFFYIMQAMPPHLRLGGMMLGVGLSQVALPMARAISPILLYSGDIGRLFDFEAGLALLCLGCVALLRLPPSNRIQTFEPLDFLTFALFAPGMALLTAVLAQGRITWWSTPWLGYALAAAVVLITLAMLIEHNRANPLLNTRWMGSRDVIRFAFIAAMMRVLLAEQNYGAPGLMTLLGMGPDQLVTLYAVVTVAASVALGLSLLTLDPDDLLRPLLISLACIAAGAFMDAHATNLTRPGNLYLSQALIGFGAVYFLASAIMVGVTRALAHGPAHIVSFSAIFSMSQTLGGLGGSALLGSFVILREKFHSHALTQSLTLADPQVAARIEQLGGAYARVLADPALRQAEGAALLAQQVTREANILAYNDVFMLIGAIATLAFFWQGARWIRLRVRGINPLAEQQAAMAALREKSMQE